MHLPTQGHTYTKSLLNYFPPPAYLTMSAIGVDVSDTTIKYVAFTDAQHGKTLAVSGEREVPLGVITSGEIKDVDALSHVLAELRREHGLSFVRASLPEEKGYLFQLPIVGLEDEDAVRSAVEFQLEDHVPIAPQDAIFSYECIKNAGACDAVSVSVYPRKIVADYAEAFHRAGLTPLSFEMEARAIARALVKKEDEGTYLIIDFGKTRAGVAVVHGTTVCFSSTLDVEGRAITDAIVKHFNITREEAERMKNEGGFIKREYSKKLSDELLDVVSALAEEIKKSYQFWNTLVEDKKEDQKIQKIILSGGNANLVGLAEYLSRKLRVPVERGNVWMNAFSFNEVIPSIDREHSLAYTTAIGLAL